MKIILKCLFLALIAFWFHVRLFQFHMAMTVQMNCFLCILAFSWFALY
jgi:hypothetical protein